LALPVVSLSAEEALDHFSYLARFVAFDNPTSNVLTRERLEWYLTNLGLVEDLGQDYYGESPPA
jgi:hypothetical protein